MEKCLVCGKVLYRGSSICNACDKKRIVDTDDYIAGREEVQLIQKLIKVEDLLS